MRKSQAIRLLKAGVLSLGLFLAAGCGGGNPSGETTGAAWTEGKENSSTEAAEKRENLLENAPAVSAEDAETWAIYWYICGSDLEEQNGCATEDLEELLSVALPSNVQVVLETGGSDKWNKKEISPDAVERFLYDASGFRKLETLEESSMGDQKTLSAFMQYCLENYPADRSMLLLWNHGGGCLGGVAYDSKYNMDYLSGKELEDAFSEVRSALQLEGKLFDMIGFDACLMSNLNALQICVPCADWMVASEETEALCGWNYKGLAGAFARNPGVTPEELGIQICDSFLEGCREKQKEQDATLALISLEQAESMLEQYEMCGERLFLDALADERIVAGIRRAALETESYGSNTKGSFTNMIDLGELVEKQIRFYRERTADEKTETASAPESIPELEKLQQMIKETVRYQVRGESREKGYGLACYFPLDRNLRSLYQYRTSVKKEDYAFLYQYMLTGKKDTKLLEYLVNRGYRQEAGDRNLITMKDLDIQSLVPKWGEDDKISLKLDPVKASYLSNVSGIFAFRLPDYPVLMVLGNTTEMESDWKKGTFSCTPPTEWWSLNGYPVSTWLVQKTDTYTVYAIPILLNGEEAFMRMYYRHRDGAAVITGIFPQMGDNYLQPRSQGVLSPDDEITIIMSLVYEEDEQIPEEGWEDLPFVSFQVGDGLHPEKLPLPACDAFWSFQVDDAWGNYSRTQMICYQILEEED